MDLYYLPTGRTWNCNNWYDVYATIRAQPDYTIQRYNVVVYNSDGTTSHYNGEELLTKLSNEIEYNRRTSGEVKVPTFEGSPLRYDEELVNRNT